MNAKRRATGPWPSNPVIHEVNTAVWLHEVGSRLGRAAGLGDVPGGEWDALALPGVDAVWLMGVWERSPEGTRIAAENPDIVAGCRAALPDYGTDDFIGSPYCIRRYRADHRFGGPDGLAAARAALAERGVRLILDFVPNHVAPDHPWTTEHPEYFVQGSEQDASADPAAWVRVAGHVLARGRDPYFPPWPDVVQLNGFAPELRAAAGATLADIASQCDGARCDMGMLLLDDVFTSTWGERAGPALPAPYWPEVIAHARAAHPDFLLMAEVYWDREPDLLAQGFDLVYDKRLYDRLEGGDVAGVRGHLGADPTYQRRLVRFLENHDEPRAAAVFAGDAERAAAVVTAAVPGALLLYEGQLDGRRTRLPVFLCRRPDEPADLSLRDFYVHLLEAVVPHRLGEWSLLATHGWPDNWSHERLVAMAVGDRETKALVVTNVSDAPADGVVEVPWSVGGAGTVTLLDELTGVRYDRDAADIAANGLYVRLAPWQSHVLVPVDAADG